MATKKTTKGGKKKSVRKSTARKSAPSKTARSQAYSKKKTAKTKSKAKAKKTSYAKYPKNPGFGSKLQHPYMRKDSTMVGERYGDRMTGVPYSKQKYLSEERRNLGWQTEYYVDGSKGDGKAVKRRR